MRIIDLRVRPSYKSIGEMFTHRQRDEWTLPTTRAMGFEPDQSFLHDSVPELLEELGRENIVRAVIPGNRAVAPESAGAGAREDIDEQHIRELTRDHPDVFLGITAADLDDDGSAARNEEAVTSWGFVAIGVDPGQAVVPRYPDDPEVRWVYELAEAVDVPVFVKLSHQVGPDISYGDPLRLGHVASRHPTVPLVAVHGGWPDVRRMLAVASRHANVYVQPDFYLTYPGRQDYVDAANTFMRDRMLFASAYPVMPVTGMAELLRTLPFAPEVRGKVAHDNAARLLGL